MFYQNAPKTKNKYEIIPKYAPVLLILSLNLCNIGKFSVFHETTAKNLSVLFFKKHFFKFLKISLQLNICFNFLKFFLHFFEALYNFS